MGKLFAVFATIGLLSGCVVRTHSRGYARGGGNGCGPNFHWNGNHCERDYARRSAPPPVVRDHRRY